MIRRAFRVNCVASVCALAIAVDCTLMNSPALGQEQAEQGAAETQTPKTIAIPPNIPFCLKTEFFPGGWDENARPDRLAREIGRQAVLIAARDTLGLATRDETLEEPFPAAVTESKRIMNAAPRARRDGKLQLSLWAGNSTMQ